MPWNEYTVTRRSFRSSFDAELVRFRPGKRTGIQVPLMPICLDSSDQSPPDNLDIISFGTTAEQTRAHYSMKNIKGLKEARQIVAVKTVDCLERQDGYFCTQGQVQTLKGDSGGSLVYSRNGEE